MKEQEKTFIMIAHRTFGDYKDFWTFCPGMEKTKENIEKFEDSPFVFEGGYNSGSPLDVVENWLNDVMKVKEKNYTMEVTVKIHPTIKSDFEKVTRGE